MEGVLRYLPGPQNRFLGQLQGRFFERVSFARFDEGSWTIDEVLMDQVLLLGISTNLGTHSITDQRQGKRKHALSCHRGITMVTEGRIVVA